MRVTFDTNTLDPILRPKLAGAMRDDCLIIQRLLQSGRMEGFCSETMLTIEGGGADERERNETVGRIRRAVEMGMRVLSAPRRGSVPTHDLDGSFYFKDPDAASTALRLQRFATISKAIEARGLGFARVLKHRRMGHPADTGKVARARAEWADGDSVAAHFAYGNDLFCTEDRARKAGRHSVMHAAQRAWLKRAFGVEFVSIAGLAARSVFACAAV
jgi:hypothetical protein